MSADAQVICSAQINDNTYNVHTDSTCRMNSDYGVSILRWHVKPQSIFWDIFKIEFVSFKSAICNTETACTGQWKANYDYVICDILVNRNFCFWQFSNYILFTNCETFAEFLRLNPYDKMPRYSGKTGCGWHGSLCRHVIRSHVILWVTLHWLGQAFLHYQEHSHLATCHISDLQSERKPLHDICFKCPVAHETLIIYRKSWEISMMVDSRKC